MQWLPVAVLMGVLLAGAVLVQPARAAGPDKLDNSLKLVPADAAFYSTFLRNREQVKPSPRAGPGPSSIPCRMKQMWQMGEKLFSEDTPYGKLYNQPENRQLVELLLDMCSDEIFVYAGQDSLALMDVMMQINGAARFGPLLQMMTDTNVRSDPSKAQIQAILRVLAENPEQIKAPDVVFGFKTKKLDAAEKQLKRLEELLKGVVDQYPQLKGRLKRVKIGDGSFLTLTLDGKMVPWEQIPLKDYEEKPGEFDKLTKRLKTCN